MNTLKVKLVGTKTQVISSEQIKELAKYIVYHCGVIDFNGTDIVVSFTDTLYKNALRVVIKAVTESGGTITTDDITALDNDEWNKILDGTFLSQLKSIAKICNIATDKVFDYWCEFEDVLLPFNEDGQKPYLKFAGAMPVKTPIVQTTDLRIKTSFKLNDTPTYSWYSMFGYTLDSEGTSGHLMLFQITNDSTPYFGVSVGAIGNISSYVMDTDTVYTLDWEPYNNILINNEQIYSTNKLQRIDDTVNFYIGAVANSSTSDSYSGALLYANIGYFFAYHGDEMAYALVPFYRDGMYGFLDLVNDEFYGNS